MTAFVLPRGTTGFNIDDPPHARNDRRENFVAWARTVATSLDSTTTIVEPVGNFDVVELETLGFWLLQNHFLPLVGVIAQPPTAGFAYAVDAEFVDLPPLPGHLGGWGPRLLAAEILNRALSPNDWKEFSDPALAHADRFKPTQIGHVLFNYWDQSTKRC